MTRTRSHLRGSAPAKAAWLAGLALAAAPALGQEAPRDSGLREKTNARLFVAHIRVERVQFASPGECATLNPEDFSVTLRPGPIPEGWFSIYPRHREPVRETWRIGIDRSVPPSIHALVMDTSSSMIGSLEQARRAATAYVSQLRPGYEKALIATFDETVVLRQGATRDPERLERAVASIRPGGRTALLDALVHTIRELDAHPERPVMVVLSDAADTASFYSVQDVIDLAATRPDLTIFTVGVGLEGDQKGSPTRKLLRRLASVTDGTFFDVAGIDDFERVWTRIRDLLGAELVLTVVDPHPRADPALLDVATHLTDCRVRVLESVGGLAARPPIPTPLPALPATLDAPVRGAHAKLLASAERSYRSPCAGPERRRGKQRWRLRVEPGSIRTCGPDLIQEPGPLYDPTRARLMRENRTITTATRAFTVPAPPLDDLPRRPVEILERLADASRGKEVAGAREAIPAALRGAGHGLPHMHHPLLVHGTTFLEMRLEIARALFLFDEYRELAMARLRDEAERRVAVLAERYREQFSEMPARIAEAAADDSYDARRIRERAAAPSEVDLQPFLAAWLGDVPAHDLFLAWEREQSARLLLHPERAAGFPDDWGRLRDLFHVPSHARVLAPLVPVFDQDCQCIGFWRILLPRASLLGARLRAPQETPTGGAIPFDLIPDLPLGFTVLDRALAASPPFGGHLRSRSYRPVEVRYEPLGPAETLRPDTAFARSRVVVTLEAPRSSEDARPRRLELDATLRLRPPDTGDAAETAAALSPGLQTLRIRVQGDPELGALAKGVRRSLLAGAEPPAPGEGSRGTPD